MKRLLLTLATLVLVPIAPAGAILPCDQCDCTRACTLSCVTDSGSDHCSNYICQGGPGCGGGGCLTFKDVQSAFLFDRSAGAPQGLREGFAASRLTSKLAQHVDDQGLGAVYSGKTAFLVSGSSALRAPDLAFVAAGRQTPDLVARIVAAPDLASAAERDARAWLAAGARAALVVDSTSETVTVIAAGAKPKTLGRGEFLELPALLPGWSLRVADLFP